MTVEEALRQVLHENMEMALEDVLILVVDQNGELMIRSSSMNRAQANWLIDKAKMFTLEYSYEQDNAEHDVDPTG